MIDKQQAINGVNQKKRSSILRQTEKKKKKRRKRRVKVYAKIKKENVHSHSLVLGRIM